MKEKQEKQNCEKKKYALNLDLTVSLSVLGFLSVVLFFDDHFAWICVLTVVKKVYTYGHPKCTSGMENAISN